MAWSKEFKTMELAPRWGDCNAWVPWVRDVRIPPPPNSILLFLLQPNKKRRRPIHKAFFLRNVDILFFWKTVLNFYVIREVEGGGMSAPPRTQGSSTHTMGQGPVSPCLAECVFASEYAWLQCNPLLLMWPGPVPVCLRCGWLHDIPIPRRNCCPCAGRKSIRRRAVEPRLPREGVPRSRRVSQYWHLTWRQKQRQCWARSAKLTSGMAHKTRRIAFVVCLGRPSHDSNKWGQTCKR